MQTNDLPPQAPEVEMSILARCLLNDPDVAVEMITSGDFYKTAHQKIFSTILELVHHKNPVDLLSVSNELKNKGQLEDVGGSTYLAKLTDETPLAVSMEHYCGILREKALLRHLRDTSIRIYQSCHGSGDATVNADEILDNAQRSILNIENRKQFSITPVKDIVVKANERYDAISKDDKEISGIPSGFYPLDKLTLGFQSPDLVIVAGRPSMGKTAFALNSTAEMAREGFSSLFFSLEMSERQVIDRIISAESGVNGQKFKSGNFLNDDWDAINKASSKVYTWPIYIDDSSSLHYLEIIRRSRWAKKQYDIELVVVDYLQYVIGDKGQGRNYEVESITRGLKGLAKDLNIPVLLLSQLNRKCEERPHPHKRPQLSDLRDSGAIEQDADLVLFLYRPERYEEKDASGKNQPGVAEIEVAKHRNGPLGRVNLTWRERITKFENAPYQKYG